MRTKPTDATGYKFKAWVHEQVPKIRKGNGLRAAADSLECYVQAYERADKQGDDVISAAARIDACYCILVGGKLTSGSFSFTSTLLTVLV